jgi:toxin-antitoxin system PIN domain toxin
MILLDANLLLYAHVSSFPQHVQARDWLDAQLSGNGPVGLPWPSLIAFLRIVTNPRVFERPESMAEAWRQVHAWLEAEVVWIPQPTERHREVLGTLLTAADVHANLVPDAHLAALAIEHGLLLCSTDGDFGRFTDLRWQNPLSGTRRRR